MRPEPKMIANYLCLYSPENVFFFLWKHVDPMVEGQYHHKQPLCLTQISVSCLHSRISSLYLQYLEFSLQQGAYCLLVHSSTCKVGLLMVSREEKQTSRRLQCPW